MNGSVISSPITEELSADTAEQARLAWNSWQDFERENLPWLYRCEGPIGKDQIIEVIKRVFSTFLWTNYVFHSSFSIVNLLVFSKTNLFSGLFCPGPGPDVYDLIPG